MNVRNLLVGATLTEARTFLADAIERGDTECAGYAEEFICELEAECPECNDYTESAECAGCTGYNGYAGCSGCTD
jgi:hypothetical protein